MNGSTAPSSTSSSASTIRRRSTPWALGALLLTGCASTQTGTAPSPSGGSTTVNASLEPAAVAATEPKQRLRIVFDWSLQERDAKFSGSGAIRTEPPYHVRLDLFGPRGEGYLSAALVDFDGALLVASHDPDFLAAIGVTRRIELKRPRETPDGRRPADAGAASGFEP